MVHEQMACRKPIDENTALKGKKEEEFRLGRSGLQLKGRLVLLFSQKNSRTILQFKSQQKANVCVSLGLCVGVPLSLS